MTDGTIVGPCALVYEPSGPLGILSNFALTPLEIDDQVWPTAEHYFQARKFPAQEDREKIRQCPTPQGCKQLAWGELHDAVRSDWDDMRTSVMRAALEAKYDQSSAFRLALDATWPMPIIENSPIDPFWGVGADGTGENMLGRLLVEIRNARLALPEAYRLNQAILPGGTGGHSVVSWLSIVPPDTGLQPHVAAFRRLDNSRISGRLKSMSLDRQMMTSALASFASGDDISAGGDADSVQSALETWIAQLAARPNVHDEPFADFLVDEIRPLIMDMKYADYSLHEDARSVIPNWRLSIFGLFASHFNGSLRDQRVVAVGAGSANESGEIWSALGEQVTLVDIGSRLAENCKAGAPQATVIQAAAEDLSAVLDASFDIYCSFRTYQSLFFDIDRAAAEAYRVLRPGGTAIISVSNAYLGTDGSLVRGQIDANAQLNLEKPWWDLIAIGNRMRAQGFDGLRMEDLESELVVIADRV